jgi:hypothetical protein
VVDFKGVKSQREFEGVCKLLQEDVR